MDADPPCARARDWLGSAARCDSPSRRRPRRASTASPWSPTSSRKLTARGIEVVVERGAGDGALIPDAAFTDAGAQVTDDQAAVWGADAVVTIAPPAPAEIARMREGALLVGFLQPLTSAATAVAARDAKVTALAMEAIPRITRAQAMDALSSQANVAGYAAVLLAAREHRRASSRC